MSKYLLCEFLLFLFFSDRLLPHPDQLSPGYLGWIGRRGIIELQLTFSSVFEVSYQFFFSSSGGVLRISRV